MIESLVGLTVMVMVTAFMASLVQLASGIMQPKTTLTELDKSIVTQYQYAAKLSGSKEVIEEEVAKFICTLPRDTTNKNVGCE